MAGKPTPTLRQLGKRPTRHWSSNREMHRAMHRLPNWIRALLLEMLEQDMNSDEMVGKLTSFNYKEFSPKKEAKLHAKLCHNVEQAVRAEVFKKGKSGRYTLTPKGRELAEHMNATIPTFFRVFFSPEIVSRITIMVHVLLSVVKLSVGLLSRSAGLIADGIDNSGDTISSVLIWLGIRWDREKAVSIFIIVMMFVSVGGVGLAAWSKIANPEPVRDGMLAFILSALFGVLMFGISAYQYMAGRRNSNFALVCQSVDSRNHFLTSLLVCLGILLSFFSQQWGAPWLIYGDVAASLVIGVLILKSALELIRELRRAEGEESGVKHFMEKTMRQAKRKIMYNWLRTQLQEQPLSQSALKKRFQEQFCRTIPRAIILSGMGYYPETSADLEGHLQALVADGKLRREKRRYHLS